jgi:hypothetical protein
MEEGILQVNNYLHFIHNDAKATLEALPSKGHKMR